MAYNLGYVSTDYNLGYTGAYTAYPYTAPYGLVDSNSLFAGQSYTDGSSFQITTGPSNGTLDAATAEASSLWGNDVDDIYTPTVDFKGYDTVTLTIRYADSSTAQWTATIKVGVPEVASVTLPTAGSYKAGNALAFTVTFDEAVDVTGTPQLALDVGGTVRQADYASGTGTSALVFSYTVQSGDNDATGLDVTALALNGGAIQDQETTPSAAILTLNSVGTTVVKVDTVKPVITVLGNNPFALENGTSYTDAGATASDTQSGALGTVTGTGTVDSNTNGTYTITYSGAGIVDTAGNVADNTTRTVNVVNTLSPTVVSVAVPANGSYKAAGVLTFTVTFDEAVNVTGTPQIALSIGGTTRQANYVSGAGSSALVFSYTVQSGDNDANGIGVTSLGTNGGTIKDSGGDAAILTLNAVGTTASVRVDTVKPAITVTGTNPFTLEKGATFSDPGATAADDQSGALGSVTGTHSIDTGTVGAYTVTYPGTGIVDAAGNVADDATRTVNVVDTTGPSVLAVAANADATYAIGDTPTFTVTFNDTVVVTGTPQLNIDVGGVARAATYQSGTGTSSLVFQYVVVEGDVDTDGVGITDLTLAGGTLQDTAGNAADLTLVNVSSTTGVLVDGIRPVVVLGDLETSSATPVVSGSSGDALSLTLLVTGVGTYTPSPLTGTWSQQLPTLTDGTYAMTLDGADASGNTAVQATATLTVSGATPVTPPTTTADCETSGATAFNLQVDEVIEEAYERIGMEVASGYDARTARRSLNLMMTEWANRQITLWTVERRIIPCVVGQADYVLSTADVDVMEVAVRVSSSDYVIGRTSRNESLYIPNKAQGGRPTQWVFNRTVPAAIQVWPVPDRNMSLVVDLFKFTEDVTASAQCVATPRRFLPAMVAGLAYHLALKKRPQLVGQMRQLYEEALMHAANADEEVHSFTVRPRRSGR